MEIAVQKMQWGINVAEGYVGFTVRKRDAIAAGIRWFEKEWRKAQVGPVPSHTFIVTGPDATIEAFGNGVGRGTLTAYLNDPDVALLIRRPAQWTAAMGRRIADEASKHVGHRYGRWLIFGMAVSNSFLGLALNKLTRGAFGRKVRQWTDETEAEVCSEVVALSMKAQPELDRRGQLVWPARDATPYNLFKDQSVFEPWNCAVELVD